MGVVSARLLAAGTPRLERLRALSLLGLLLDHAGPGGRVRVTLDRIVGEFDLPPVQAEQALEALVHVEAVGRDDDGIVVVGYQPPAPGGLRLSAFLANVAAVLDADQPDPAPAPQPRSPVLSVEAAPPAPAGDVRRRWVRSRQPALAALALTAVVLLATLGPSSDAPTPLRTVGEPQPAPSEPVAGPGSGAGVPPGPSAPPSGSSEEPLRGDDRAAGEDDPSSPAGPGDRGPSAPAPAERGSADQRSTAPEPDGSTAGAAGRAPAPPPAAVPGQPPTPPVACPLGVPQIVVDSAVVRPAGPDVVLGVPTTSVAEVRGALVNPTGAAVVIRSFEVVLRSGAQEVVVPGPPEPVTLAAGQRQEWTVRSSPIAEPAAPPTVEGARIIGWQWQDAGLARSCPA